MESAKVARKIVHVVTETYGCEVNVHGLGDCSSSLMWQNQDKSLSIFTILYDGSGAIYLNSDDGGKTVYRWEKVESIGTDWLEDEMKKHAGR